jgi:hypothetical protein
MRPVLVVIALQQGLIHEFEDVLARCPSGPQ